MNKQHNVEYKLLKNWLKIANFHTQKTLIYKGSLKGKLYHQSYPTNMGRVDAIIGSS